MFTKEDLIHAYTRRDALEDGVLIEVSRDAKYYGFRVGVALTAAVWHRHVELEHGCDERKEASRLRDLLSCLGEFVRAEKPTGRIAFFDVEQDYDPQGRCPFRLKVVSFVVAQHTIPELID